MILRVSCQDFSQEVRKLYLDTENKFVGVTLGEGAYIVDASLDFGSLYCHVLVGKYSSIGHRVKFIAGLNHNSKLISTYPFRDIYGEKICGMLNTYCESNHNQIIIGNDVWIGADVTVLGGVKISDGAVIAAGAVVANDVPPYAVMAGNPAKIVKYRFAPDIINTIQRIKWWNWSRDKIRRCWQNFENTEAFLQKYGGSMPTIQDDMNSEVYILLKSLRDKGYRIYYFQPDLLSEEKVWKNVVKNILPCLDESTSVLVIALDNVVASDSGKKYFLSLIDGSNKDNVVVLDKLEAEVVVRLADCLITTKEPESSRLIDLASNECQIIYGYDMLRGN